MNYLIFLSLLRVLSCNNNPNCPKGSHSAITIVNRSPKNIYYDIYWNYPDTTIGQYNPTHSNDLLKPSVGPVRIVSPNGSNSCREEIFLKSEAENIYFFDTELIEKVPWEEVQKKQYRPIGAKKS